MKKVIILAVVVLLCASVVFALTKKDLASLKGTWEGTAKGGSGTSINVKLEIMNDTEPLQGRITFSNIPGQFASEYGVSNPYTAESNDGKLTSLGTIFFTGPNGFFEIQSVKDKKLTGWGYAKGFRANISATKK